MKKRFKAMCLILAVMMIFTTITVVAIESATVFSEEEIENIIAEFMEISCEEEMKNFVADVYGVPLEDVDLATMLTSSVSILFFSCDQTGWTSGSRGMPPNVEELVNPSINALTMRSMFGARDTSCREDAVLMSCWPSACNPWGLISRWEEHWRIGSLCVRIDVWSSFRCLRCSGAVHILESTINGCGSPCRLG